MEKKQVICVRFAFGIADANRKSLMVVIKQLKLCVILSRNEKHLQISINITNLSKYLAKGNQRKAHTLYHL